MINGTIKYDKDNKENMFKKIVTTFIVIITTLLINNSYGHSGRTNSEGCHNKYSDGTYHCHGKKY